MIEMVYNGKEPVEQRGKGSESAQDAPCRCAQQEAAENAQEGVTDDGIE